MNKEKLIKQAKELGQATKELKESFYLLLAIIDDLDDKKTPKSISCLRSRFGKVNDNYLNKWYALPKEFRGLDKVIESIPESCLCRVLENNSVWTT